MSIADNLIKYKKELEGENVELIAVSKFNDAAAILEAYNAGQRIFGENIVQELAEKAEALPKDIQWHMIGHLQTNKVKYIAPFISLIQSVDSIKLLAEINKQAAKHNRVIDCLLQVYIADEDTKFGLDHAEVIELLRSEEYLAMKNIRITGLMGIASNNAEEKQTKDEFQELKVLFDGIKLSFFRKDEAFRELSMGMSGDYKLAIEEGTTMVRIGSSIFGVRKIKHYKS